MPRRIVSAHRILQSVGGGPAVDTRHVPTESPPQEFTYRQPENAMSRRRLTTVGALAHCLMIAVWCEADDKAFADAQTEYATVAREARDR